MVRTIGDDGASEKIHKIPEAVVLGFWLTRTRNFFGIDQMSRPPIALDESPRASNVDCVPTIPESIVLEANPWLITSRFAVTLYHYTVQSRVTVREHNRMNRERKRSVRPILKRGPRFTG